VSAAATDDRTALYRTLLVASVTCTALLALAGVVSALAWLDVQGGGLALVFLLRLGGGYLLPIGGFVFAGLAVLVGQQWKHRRTAVAALIASVVVTVVLYGLAAKFVELG
jgi:hypothetical protein